MSHIPRCYGNHSETSITPFLSLIEFMFGIEVLGTTSISCIPCCHGNLVGIATKVKPSIAPLSLLLFPY